MILGIVGPEQSAWTPDGEEKARAAIRDLLQSGFYTGVTSGACPKGGVDIWAREEAIKAGFPVQEFPAEKPTWYWFKKRNQQIAKLAVHLVCITPAGSWCYHCKAPHRVSGGCWTLNYAKTLGKRTDVIVIYGPNR